MNDCRILLLDSAPPWGLPMAGAGWQMLPCSDGRVPLSAELALITAECRLSDAQLDHLALPLVLALTSPPTTALLDRAAGWLLPDDGAGALDRIVAGLLHGQTSGVAESMANATTAQNIAALSAEARRIAEALDNLAKSTDVDQETPISPALVRRLIRLRRDRDRHFPAEIFADPAWDMLLDLTAARMEGVDVPVSSLCVAAAVPTTTALRWIRTLSEAGMLQRRIDTSDARRSFVTLSDAAHAGIVAWLRRFSGQFQLR